MKHILTCILFVLPAAFSCAATWKDAQAARPLTFPRDHGSHPDHRVEWWYCTGNVESEGRRFGYQLTFFRIGVQAEPPNPSRWAVRDLHMAHFAISDPAESRFLHTGRLGRAGAGFNGAATENLRVWQENWSAAMDADGVVHLKAAAHTPCAMSLTLTLKPPRGPVPHGENGFSRKGQTGGGGSTYYSLTRLETSGVLAVDGKEHRVTGLSWMDHEFGTHFLDASRQGWDWISLHLADGSDLMVYRLRDQNRDAAPLLSGTLVEPDGAVVWLGPEDLVLTPGQIWKSPETGGEYPVRWRLHSPSRGLKLEISAPFPEQELVFASDHGGPSYWEGVMDAAGTRSGQSVTGRGYLEMTGYAGRELTRFFALPENP